MRPRKKRIYVIVWSIGLVFTVQTMYASVLESIIPDMHGITINNHSGTVNVIFVPPGSTVDVQTPTGEKMSIASGSAFPGAGVMYSPLLKNCKDCWIYFMDHVVQQWDKKTLLYAYLKENRWSIMLKTLVSFYVGINYFLFRMAQFLTAPQRWMYWRSDLFLVQLMRMSPTELIQDLLATLNEREELAPDQIPFQMLFDELDDEICQLQRYNRLIRSITILSHMQSHCAAASALCVPSILGLPLGHIAQIMLNAVNIKNMFYIQEQLVQHAPEYLKRLMYLRRILEEELAVDLPQAVP